MRTRLSSDTRELLSGLLFTSPFIVGFVAFSLYPFIASGYYSFTEYHIVDVPRWIGLDNYRKILGDKFVHAALFNTAYFTFISVPLGVVVALILALILNVRVRGLAFYRTLYFVPTIVPTVALAVMWLWILNPQFGLVNTLLGAVGLPTPGWLADPLWSKPALIIMQLWGAGAATIIFLAGLQSIPTHLLEAAEIDGAGRLRRFRHVTVPMLSPIILFNFVIGLIGAFQYFTQAYVMTGGTGGPLNSTLFYAILLYRQAFEYIQMGFASAMAWLMFFVILLLTMLTMFVSKRWVYYEGG